MTARGTLLTAAVFAGCQAFVWGCVDRAALAQGASGPAAAGHGKAVAASVRGLVCVLSLPAEPRTDAEVADLYAVPDARSGPVGKALPTVLAEEDPPGSGTPRVVRGRDDKEYVVARTPANARVYVPRDRTAPWRSASDPAAVCRPVRLTSGLLGQG